MQDPKQHSGLHRVLVPSVSGSEKSSEAALLEAGSKPPGKQIPAVTALAWAVPTGVALGPNGLVHHLPGSLSGRVRARSSNTRRRIGGNPAGSTRLLETSFGARDRTAGTTIVTVARLSGIPRQGCGPGGGRSVPPVRSAPAAGSTQGPSRARVFRVVATRKESTRARSRLPGLVPLAVRIWRSGRRWAAPAQ